MKLTRREALVLSAGAALIAFAGGRAGPAFAGAAETDQAIKDFTGGTEPQSGRITLTAPEIAENGNTVPVSVYVESPMTAEDHVASVMLLAEGNPNPDVATFHFTPMSGEATATTRMRLAKTQNVVAVAKMSDGSVYVDRKEVKVTIGGCGG
ncbi:thiosulfate oxidation carrier protein SoxY [Afifella sp. IM 167]|uniref:thiosulfate oxidation carrier protein SoxY n=1 Tax=Afifella sp. IM 167 TaxID=2033586 RepID=UPI001CCCB18A|nr:thiosulfate oxidation carrier protein SoxY [Afifella sp. IM 167]MBZ8132007.1 thiosulfate oxidation carrier protein SoxY [Afifella sp. IM 167]